MFLKQAILTNFLFVALLTMAQAQSKFNYNAAWKKVDDLVTKKGLTETALKEVQTIYASALKEKNDAQQIKALVFRVNLQNQKEEEADVKAILQIEKEITKAADPAKSILTNLLAEAYWQYLQNNRWKFYNRTNLVDFKREDFATWTVDEFHKKISSLFLSSLQNEKQLKETKLSGFEAIIEKGNMRQLRPTLYDLLVHRAIAYFENDERNINKPADAFEINAAAAFDPAADFITRKFVTTDSASLHYKALLLYQKLIAFHSTDKTSEALVDVDIKRFEFVNRYATLENKNELYRLSLNHIWKQYNFQPIASQAAYLLAKDYADFAATYDFIKHKTDDATNPRWYYKKAIELCNNVLVQKENSEGKVNCSNLLNQINQKELLLNTEQVNIPNHPFRTLVTYKNTKQLWFRIVKVTKDPTEEERENYWEEGYWKNLAKLAPVQSFMHSMPATDDYQMHKTEIKIPSLPSGTYLILASANQDFSTGKNLLSAQYIYISSIAWLHNGADFFVLNRETGKPLYKAAVQIWKQGYDYNKSKYVNTKGENYSTDANGYFKLKVDEQTNYNRRLEISYEKDRLFLNDNLYNYNYRQVQDIDEIKNRRVFLFTDRSIYRPGQTVYFKGILTTTDAATKKPKISAGVKTTIILYDANYQKIDSIKLTTNEYGSYNGKFTLPQGQLNGIYRIKDESVNSEQSFSVEEYKRPKFYVEYLPVKGSFKINDNIKIIGTAKAYAGNNIDNAKVKYRVVRQPRLLYPWLSWRWGLPQMDAQEIAHGETITNADGTFIIEFTSVPDKQVRKELDPVFDYKIIADVTDLNGETRTGETEVSVSYKSLQLQIGLPKGETMAADSLQYINISTLNTMGVFEKATVTVTMHRIDAPKRFIRSRFWQQPDQFIITQEAYLKDFPYDEYNDEGKKENWKRGEMVLESTDSSSLNGKFDVIKQKSKVKSQKLTPGWYMIEAITKDKNGEEVKNISFLQLVDGKTFQPVAPAYVWSLPTSITKEPGEKATIEFGSSASDLFVIEQEDKDLSKDPFYSFMSLNNEKKQIVTTVEEKNRGGFGYVYSFVKHNRFYTTSRYVNVPWSNKELTISYETFRDKTLPGSNEEWKIKISGYKGDKVAAELLTSMYDASLDQFKTHAWYKPSLFNTNNIRNNWAAGGFLSSQSWQRNFEQKEWLSFDKRYDELVSLSLNSRMSLRIRGTSSMVLSNAPAAEMVQQDSELNEVVVNGMGNTAKTKKKNLSGDIEKDEEPQSGEVKNNKTDKSGNIQIRKNFNETVFFFPDLQTDSAGNVIVKFTMPESLTKWKWQLLSHTKDLSMGLSQKEMVTQKELMVQPFAPRFLREGDRFEFTAKITNLSDKEVTGTSNLQLLNATTLQSVDGWFQNTFPLQHFTVAAGQSTVVKFRTEVPYDFNEALTYRITAKASPLGGGLEGASDGEEMTLPVLTNRMLVTESLPLPMRGSGTKNFTFTKLLNTNSSTLVNHKFTIEFTSNPAWYAVQALPYIMDYPYECAEQTWNRFYANALAMSITQKLPRIQKVFDQWKTKDTAALLSNLQKNEELKSVLLQETPWVLEAKSEEQQKKNIAVLFNLLRMSKELNKAIEQLKAMQSSNGGFVWFNGGPDDQYITQYIVTGIGHLKKLNAVPKEQEKTLNNLVAKALPYLDRKLKEEYEYLLKQKVNLKTQTIGYSQIQYLYMRSFFNNSAQTKGTEIAYAYYFKQSQQYWLQQSKYMQGMIALALSRSKDVKTASAIVKSLKENALNSEEMGMYWKEFNSGYYWYQAPVESQAMMIEVFHEVANDETAVANLKTWLLKQKQTQNWKTTIATAEACYALLLQGDNWITAEPFVEIKAGTQVFSSSPVGGGLEGATEAGTGYFKRSIDGSLVKPEMGNMSVRLTPNPSPGGEGNASHSVAWGAAYWQYFENLDKITSAETPLKLKKKYFVERNTGKGPVLVAVEEGTELKVGDKIKVRIELRVDRNMEYVHMKDMRPSCMEPVNVISTYKWQGGLGYYESTKDASTNFFFGWLSKGTYVFEYPMYITHAGNYSSGITTIQCMYATEFTSHSEGVRVSVKE